MPSLPFSAKVSIYDGISKDSAKKHIHNIRDPGEIWGDVWQGRETLLGLCPEFSNPPHPYVRANSHMLDRCKTNKTNLTFRHLWFFLWTCQHN